MAAEPRTGAERPARLALLIGLVLAAQDDTNRPLGVVILLALAVLLGVSTQWRIGPLIIVTLAVAGLAMRLDLLHVGTSDVLTVTRSAIQTVLAGGNPYGVGFPTSSPPGAPFPYGPLALAWYLPFLDDARVVETAVSFLIVVLLAVRGRPLGLAVYALALPLLLTASDGSNDTSGGLLLLAALVVLPRQPLGGGALLALATAFKPYAAAWLIPLLVWAPVPGLIGFVVVSLVAWAPVYLVWGVPSFLDSLGRSQSIHGGPYYSLGAWLAGVVPGVSEVWLDRVRYVLGAATAVAAVPFIRSGRGVVVAGLLIYLVTLYTGYWSTFAYLASIVPIVCWNLDEWVGLEAGRIPWPGDPVDRLTAWADARWPVLTA